MSLKPRFSKKLDQIGDEATDILNLPLTGFVVGANTPITATDTILSAFEKTQGQINAITGGSSIFVKRDGTTPLTADWNIGNFNLGINTTPAAIFDVSKNISASAWTTNGIGLRWRAATYTDTTSSGTVATAYIHRLDVPTVAASSATTFTLFSTLSINAPTAGTNVTLSNTAALNLIGNLWFNGATRNIGTTDSNIIQFITNNTVRALFYSASNGFVIGASAPATAPIFGINIATRTSAAWTTSGIGTVQIGTTFTDSTSSGTVAAQYVNVIGAPTIAASSSTTFTLSATTFIAGPIAGTNVTQGTAAALVLGGNLLFNSGASAGLGTYDAMNLNFRTNNTTRFTITATGLQSSGQDALSSGTTAFLTYTQNSHTGGAQPFALWTAGTLTGQTASTEIIDQHFNNAATLTRAAGTVALQRGFIITGRTYAFTSPSTITLASAFDVVQAIAGTNATITTNYAQRWLFDSSNYLGVRVNSSGQTSFTASGSNPAIIFNGATYVQSAPFSMSTSVENANFMAGQNDQVVNNYTNANLLFAGASNVTARVLMRGSTNMTPTANYSYSSLIVGTQAATIAASGTHGLFANAVFKPLSITTGGGGVLNTSATVYIEGGATGATKNISLWVAQQTLGTIVQSISTTASNDDPTEDTLQNKVTTTDATVTTIATIPIPASTTLLIEARVTARRTGGSAGTAEDSAGYIVGACYKNVAGTATEVGETSIFSAEDQAGWACTVTPSGSNALLQVTGAVDNSVSWVVTYRLYPLST